jgi:hypothetical protein
LEEEVEVEHVDEDLKPFDADTSLLVFHTGTIFFFFFSSFLTISSSRVKHIILLLQVKCMCVRTGKWWWRRAAMW